MRILVINASRSSVKFSVFDVDMDSDTQPFKSSLDGHGWVWVNRRPRDAS